MMVDVLTASQFEVAVRSHERGELEKAEHLYVQILARCPDNVEAGHCAGALALQRGDFVLATKRLRRSVELGVNLSSTYCMLGRAYKGIGDLDAAIASYRQAIGLDPAMVDAHVSLGIALKQQNRFEEAEHAYTQALLLKADAFEARLNLANLYQLRGMFEAALAQYEIAEQLRPESAQLQYNIGNVLRALDRTSEAIGRFQRAAVLDPDFLDAQYNLANALSHVKRYADAVECYTYLLESIRSAADSIPINEARKSLRQNAESGLAAALIWCFRYDEALTLLRTALERKPNALALFEHLLVILPFRYVKRDELLAVYEKYQTLLPVFGEGPLLSTDTEVPTKLRLGFLSGDFRDHSVAFFLEPILANYDRQSFQVICYSANVNDDAVTERLRTYVDDWVDAKAYDDSGLAQRIVEDRVDILVDLAGRTIGNRLGTFIYRPAVLQVSYLGYPTYSGVRQITHRVTDEAIDPDDYGLDSERPLRLSRSMFCYRPTSDAPMVNTVIGGANGRIRFGSFNQVQKISPEILEAWIQILQAVPGSSLCLKAYGFGNDAIRRRVSSAFTNAGIDGNRLQIRPGEAERKNHLAMYRDIDIALDTYPYNGATTTCEALWMGVPVISWCGETHASRVGASILSAMGLKELVAESMAAYVNLATNITCDTARLSELHGNLRMMFSSSSLRDESGFTRDFERTLLVAWREQRRQLQALQTKPATLGTEGRIVSEVSHAT